jgi:methyl-accepting chemotaxis protein
LSSEAHAVIKFEKLIGNISEDLNVVRDRVRSANVSAAREKVESKCATGPVPA